MKTPTNVLIVILAFSGFFYMLGGYVILFRQAFANPDRGRMIKQILNLPSMTAGLDPRGLRLIFTGAKLEVCLFAFFFLYLVLHGIFK